MELIIDSFSKSFEEKSVFKPTSFSFQQDKIYGLIGRNGSGKTTLFNCIANKLSFEGSINLSINGELVPRNQDSVGFVASEALVPEFLTGYEFLKFFLEMNPDINKTESDIGEYFDFLNIVPEDQNRLMKDYSLGMKNKMQMLIHILSNPPILLFDEPLTSFDVVASEQMKNVLRSIKKDHILIFSTHIMELALDLCDEIVIIKDGKLEEIAREDLNNEEYKDKIIDTLKDSTNA